MAGFRRGLPCFAAAEMETGCDFLRFAIHEPALFPNFAKSTTWVKEEEETAVQQHHPWHPIQMLTREVLRAVQLALPFP